MLRSENTIPSYLVCPISNLIFLHPVTVSPSGHIYEKAMVDTLIANATKEGKQALCPVSRKPIKEYVSAWSMISAVDDYLKAHPDAVKDQFKDDNEETNVNKSQNNSTNFISSTLARQISEDEEIAGELQQQEQLQAPVTEFERAARNIFERPQIQSVRPTQAQERWNQERLERQKRDEEVELQRQHRQEIERQAAENKRQWAAKIARKVNLLNPNETKDHQELLSDVQNLIYALKFLTGPQPRGRSDELPLLIFAFFEHVEPLPWQKIKVAEGPKCREAMFNVLIAALRSLKELDPQFINAAKEQYEGQYNRVKTWFGGELSLSAGYAKFADAMGTVKDQPGYLIDQILLRVDHLLKNVFSKHPELNSEETSAILRIQPK